jgi:hypothetical protein
VSAPGSGAGGSASAAPARRPAPSTSDSSMRDAIDASCLAPPRAGRQRRASEQVPLSPPQMQKLTHAGGRGRGARRVRLVRGEERGVSN